MNRKQLREAARDRLDDWAEPPGWSDAELNSWIDEAIREASLRTGLNTETVLVTTPADVGALPLPERIAYIHAVRWQPNPLSSPNQSRPLMRVSRQEMDMRWSDWRTASGDPVRYAVKGRSFLISPKPTTAGELEVYADVYPPALERDSDEPDINPILHRSLLEWVIYRAGQKRDVDFNLPNPEQYEANFTRTFGPRASERTRQGWLESGGIDTLSPSAWRYSPNSY